MSILTERRDARVPPFTRLFFGYAAPDGSGVAGALRGGIAFRRPHGGQRHPLHAHMASGGRPVRRAAAGRYPVPAGVAGGSQRPVQILEMDISDGTGFHSAAGDAAGHRGQHRQQGVAGFSVPAGTGAACRDRQADLDAGAGQAAGVAQGKPQSEQHPLHHLPGGPSGRDLCPVLQGVLGYGQRIGASVYLHLYVLCGRRGAAMVPAGRRDRRRGILGAVGSQQDTLLHEAPVSGAVRPQP